MAETTKPDLDQIRECVFNEAKGLFAIALGCRTAIVLLGVAFAICGTAPAYLPVGVFLMTLVAEVALIQSDSLKADAERLLRKLESRNAFGWPIAKGEVSDLLVRYGGYSQCAADEPDQPYYASRSDVGERRALEMVEESAWWSKHLARLMCGYCLAGSIVGVLTTLVVVLVGTLQVGDVATRSKIAQVSTGVLMLILSLGLIRLTLGYYTFSRKAEKAEETAERLLGHAGVDLTQSIKVMHEYQLARAGAPLIPQYVYEHNQARLDRAWEIRTNPDQGV